MLKTYKDVPNWKKEISMMYYQAVNECSSSLTDLYLNMEKVASAYITKGEMSAGEEFVVHLSNMATLKIVFYAPFSEVYLLNKNTDQWNCILTRSQSSRIHEHRVLEYYDKLLKANGLHIGPPAPRELFSYLSQCKTGEMLNFHHGNSYICIPNKDNDEVYLQKVTDKNTDTFSMEDIKNSETIRLPLQANEIEQFYQENCQLTNALSIGKVQLDTFAQEYLNNLYVSLPLYATKKIILGKEVLFLTRSGMRRYAWKDANGKNISEEAVRLILGHIHTRGVEREYKHKKTSVYTKFNDMYVDQQVDEAIKCGNFSDVYDILAQYVLSEKQSLTITNKGYRNEDGNYIATGYAFKYDSSRGICRMFRLNYENNDVNGVELMSEEAQKEEFIDFYKELYQENKTMLIEQTLYSLEQKYGLPKTEIMKNSREYVANMLAGKNISLVDGEEIQNDLKKDIQISFSEDAVDSLLESFLDERE